MKNNIQSSVPGRRKFLMSILPAGPLFCLGCSSLSAATGGRDQPKAPEKKHKFLEDSGMTMKDVFWFAYRSTLIPLLKSLAKEMGQERFMSMMKNIFYEKESQEAKRMAQEHPQRDLAKFMNLPYAIDSVISNPKRFWSLVNTAQVIEDTAKAYEMKVTECLWAQTFREANASDIGYIIMCAGDIIFAEAFDTRLKLRLTKTLMNGDDCCNHRYTWEG